MHSIVSLSRHGRLRRATIFMVMGILSAVLPACGSDTTGPAPIAADQLYWKMQLRSRAITLALTPPYDTVQLSAVPMAASGDTLMQAGMVTYTGTDSTVTVSPTGLVTAHYLTQQTAVVASLTVGGVTHVDTAFIKVTATRAFALATLSIQLRPGDLDSAKVAYLQPLKVQGRNGNLPVYATDSTGTEQCDLFAGCPFLIDFTSSNPAVAVLGQNGNLTLNDIGKATLHASALVYGVSKTDSLVFTVGYPIRNLMDIKPDVNGAPWLSRSSLTVGVGGRVNYSNTLAQPVEMVWPYQTQKIFNVSRASAKLTDTLQPGNLRVFRFDSAGTYDVHVTVLDGSGRTTTGHITASSGP